MRPGLATDELDRLVHELTLAAGAYPSPYNYNNFPKSVCTSVNEVRITGTHTHRQAEKGKWMQSTKPGLQQDLRVRGLKP